MNSIDLVQEALQTALGTTEVSGIRELSSGTMNAVFRAETRTSRSDSQPVVLKLYRGNNAGKRAAAEVAACELLRDWPVPVPTIFASDALHFDHPYVVMSVVPGHPFESVITTINSDDRRHLAEQVARVAAAIAQITLPRYGTLDRRFGDGFADWDECFRNRLQGALTACAKQGIVDDVFVARCLTAVDSRREVLECSWCGPRLTHGDLVPKNVGVNRGKDGWEVTGVYDFEHAGGACPDWELVQIRRTLFRRFPETEDSFLNAYEQAGGRPSGSDWRASKYEALMQLYKLTEHAEFWEWGVGTELGQEVRSSVDYVARHLAILETNQ